MLPDLVNSKESSSPAVVMTAMLPACHQTGLFPRSSCVHWLLLAVTRLLDCHSRLSEAFTKAAAAFRKRPASILKPAAMAFVLATYAVHEFTMVHPFLLADNRYSPPSVLYSVIDAHCKGKPLC